MSCAAPSVIRRPRPARPATVSSRAIIVAATLIVCGALPDRTLAQDPEPPVGAVLVGSVHDSTSAGPLVGAAVYLVGTPHVTVTDEQGAFALPGLDAGTYTISVRHARFDSIGVSNAPSWEIDLAGTGVTRIALAIPSMTTLMPNLCILGEGTNRGIAVGTVKDAATGTPLPQASVDFDARGRATVTVDTDARGRYVACGLPTELPLAMRATFFRRAPAVQAVTLEPEQPLFTAFELEVSPGVEVTGRVVDQSTGGPVAGAVVVIESADGEIGRVLTDEDGRFDFDRVELDTYLVDVQHLAYGQQMKWFTVDDVEPIELELGLVPDAIELDALVVSVRSRAPGRAVDAGVRRDFVSRAEIDRLMGSVRNVGDLVRTIPGVRVQNLRDPVSGQMTLCIEGRRSYTGRCDSVVVVIDGIISDTEMLEDLPPNIIESIELIPSVIAGMRYGGRTGSGVLEITTRR